MLAGIVSDTLALTSPTTTEKDKEVVFRLEEISGLKYKTFANEIFSSSINLEKKSEYDLITIDIKSFQNNGKSFKVSQIITMNIDSILKRKDRIIEELNKFKEITHSDFVILMITDIIKNGSYILYDNTPLTYNVLQRAFNEDIYEGMYLENVVSRKKQVIPLLMEIE